MSSLFYQKWEHLSAFRGQVIDNLESLDVLPFSKEELDTLSTFYWDNVHDYIRGAY
ncbi:hypothetical protein IRB23SM22_07640 [Alkalibacterium sp. s-m-22]|uniref:Uncharacterized protein n=1 Tax=Alkalibacterium indicireducens TaxID=398758 RepID=A0ABP3KW71_9LACT